MIPGLIAGGLAFLSGVLSVLSPCILPLLPIVLGAARSEHRRDGAAIVIGVVTSFVAIGIFIAAIGLRIGVDGESFRLLAAVSLIVVGLAMVFPVARSRLAAAGGPLSAFFERRSRGLEASTPAGQFVLGILLGAAWAPCAGPALGAASLLAARGDAPAEAAAIMGAFGAGAALPLATLGVLSRQTQIRWRGRLLRTAVAGETALGATLASIGFAISTGLDKRLEAALVAASPDWLLTLTTSY